MTVTEAAGAPRPRNALLDVLRGSAILGILYANVVGMGLPAAQGFGQGWSAWDWHVYGAFRALIDGTERGLLELLFGAGAVILTVRAARPDGPVEVADLFFRRHLWLFAFGMVNVFALLWAGDILHVYAIAGLLLFPFRRLRARWLAALAMLYVGLCTYEGVSLYAERAALVERAGAGDAAAAEQLRRSVPPLQPSAAQRASLAREEAARRDVASYVALHHQRWLDNGTGAELFDTVVEAFATMLLGMAACKAGVLSGERGRGFYAALAVIGYGLGVGARLWDWPTLRSGRPDPHLLWLVEEPARLAITFGHVGLVALLLGSGTGRRLLAPLGIVGRAAFSVYLFQSLVAMWIVFAPWGPGLWGRFQWVGQATVATVIDAGLALAAILWLRRCRLGPMEWLWRSLVLKSPQPMRR